MTDLMTGWGKVHKRLLLATGWFTLVSALIAMIIGHTGSHALDWEINQISTYAATAPHDRWITTSMLLSCLAIGCISILLTRYKTLGDSTVLHAVPMLSGSVIAGLATLAAFEETASTLRALKSASFEAIRQQSFHDAGLLIFFYGSIVLAVVLGLLIIARATDSRKRMIGWAIAALGAAAFPLMTTAWPRLLGIVEAVPGLKQRASLLSLWLAMALVLAVLSNKAFESPSPVTQRRD